MDWKIWYGDGSTFSDQDGRWEEAPCEQVISVTVRDLDDPPVWTRRMLNSRNFYVWVTGDRYPIHTEDLTSQLPRMGVTPPDPFPEPDYLRGWLDNHGIRAQVKFAVLICDDEWRQIMQQAHEDHDFVVGTTPGRREEDWSV
jgi:hypothetical protein